MLLHSFGPDVKPWSDYARAIRAELNQQSPWALNLHEESLATARFNDENVEAAFVEYIRALFAKQQPDLIVSIGAPAAGFVQRHRQKLFSDIPMVLTVVDQRRVQYSVLTANDAVVAVTIDYFRAFENILQVLPDTKTVSVVVGNSPIEHFWKTEIGNEVKPLANRISLTWYNDFSFEDILKHAAALPPQSAIFWELMVVDAAGVQHEEGSALTRLHAIANAPIFSYTDAFFGHEIVGGPHVPVLEVGRRTAEVAVRILRGENAGEIKVAPIGFGTPKYDWREMQRWGISESRLPPASEIYFREPSAWNRYREEIIGVGALLLVQTALIGWLIYEHRRRQRAEVESRQSMAELTFMNRRAAAGELSASIAHEVNQPLTAIATRAGTALRWLRADTPDLDKVRGSLEQIVTASHRAAEIVTSIRAMFRRDTSERVPIDINKLTLTVLSIVRIDLQKNGVELEIRLDEEVPTLQGDRVQLQQVVLNLVMNAIEALHSVQHRVLKVQTDHKPGLVRVLIEDTGPGIDPSRVDRIFKPLFTTKATGTGMGLAICHSIIESHNGRIWATPGANGGSIFQFELPTSPAKG
jgi:signal transduction histidine kinase